MTIHTLPDGTVASSPDGLDTPPAAAVDILSRVTSRLGLPAPDDVVGRARLGDPRESFIPPVYGADPVAAAARDLDAALDLSAPVQSPDFWRAVGRLHDVIGGAA